MRDKFYETAPEAVKIQRSLGEYLAAGPLGKALVELVYLRVSQINGCAYCLDMHATALRKEGVDQRKMDVLAGWREARSLFDEREQLALEVVEALVPVCRDGVPDELYARARKVFDGREITDLVFTIGLMSSWNRVAIAFHAELPRRAPAKAAAE
jgi:AhpD family alkylhydroperoxidase